MIGIFLIIASPGTSSGAKGEKRTRQEELASLTQMQASIGQIVEKSLQAVDRGTFSSPRQESEGETMIRCSQRRARHTGLSYLYTLYHDKALNKAHSQLACHTATIPSAWPVYMRLACESQAAAVTSARRFCDFKTTKARGGKKCMFQVCNCMTRKCCLHMQPFSKQPSLPELQLV